VSSPGGNAPTGPVTFYSCSPSQLANAEASTCSDTIGSQIGSPVNLTPGQGGNASTANSGSITPNQAGTWCFAGYYAGQEGVFSPSSDASSDECFQVDPTTSSTTTQQSLNSSGQGTIAIGGGVWHDTATVVGNAAGGAPTGTVQFFECGPNPAASTCDDETVFDTQNLTPVPNTDNSTAASIDVPAPTQAGVYCFAALYVPSTDPPANYVRSSDNLEYDTVDPNECVDVTPSSSTTSTQNSLTGSGEGSVVLGPGVTWRDVATVTGNATAGAPTGTVDFFLCGPSTGPENCATSGTPFDTETLAHGGGGGSDAQATSATVPVPHQAGTYCFSTVYVPRPGSSYQGSSGNAPGDPIDSNECVVVTPANSSTSTQQSTTKSGPGSIVIGAGTWTDTATVQGDPTGGPPTGVVLFYECGPTTANALCTESSPWTQVGSTGVTLAPGGGANAAQATSENVAIPTQVGTYCFAAIYAPDASSNYSASSDNTTGDSVNPNECVDVTPASSTTLTQQSLDESGQGTIAIGGGVWHDTATVEGNSAGGSPTGTVQFFECGPNTAASTCDDSGTPFDTQTLTPGGGANNAQATSADVPAPTALGVYCFATVYVPSTDPPANYQRSSDNTEYGGTADPNECVDVTPAPSTTVTQNSLTDSGEGSVVIGPLVTWNDVVTVQGNSAGGPPTGTVKFYACGPTSGPENCATSDTPFDTETLAAGGGANNAQATSSNVETPTAVGTYCFSAVYIPSTDPPANYSGSTDNTPGDPVDSNECVVVGYAPSATTTQQSTTTAGAGSIVIGPDGTWTDEATVAGNSAGGAPTGTVTFYICGPAADNELCTPDSPWTQVGSEAVGLTTGSDNQSTATSVAFGPPNQVGTFCFAAVYTPDNVSNYNGSSDNTTGDTLNPNECVSVTPAPSTTTTQQSLSSTGSGTIVLGSSATWTDTATVAGNSAGGAPQGTVSFFECGPTSAPALCTDGTQVGSAENLTPVGESDNSSATSTQVTSPTQAGFYCFAAVYTPPDSGSNYQGSSDNQSGDIQANECVDVTSSPTTSPSTTIPTTTPTTAATTTSGPSTKPSTVAFTGADIAAMTVTGVTLLGLGGLLVLISRRRRQAGGAE
jgi:hypothetical protein